MEKAKAILVDFFNTLSIYDYIGFFITFILFFLFLILALLIRQRTVLALSSALLGFISLFGGPVIAHQLVKHSFYKSSAKITETKQLYYSDTLILRGVLHYLGKKDANHCKVEAAIHKKSPNAIKDFVYSMKSFISKSKDIDKALTKGDSVDFKIVIEPFNYQGDYNITVDSGCYK